MKKRNTFRLPITAVTSVAYWIMFLFLVYMFSIQHSLISETSVRAWAQSINKIRFAIQRKVSCWLKTNDILFLKFNFSYSSNYLYKMFYKIVVFFSMSEKTNWEYNCSLVLSVNGMLIYVNLWSKVYLLLK